MDMLDDLFWLAETVRQEAGGESHEGKVAVAFVIATRARQAKESISQTVLKPWQFSCWNTESPTRRMVGARDTLFSKCYAAACAAYFALVDDPTKGADHYLNEAATRAGREDGGLPKWFDESKVTARIGRHTFLKLS